MPLAFHKGYLIVHTARVFDEGEVPPKYISVAAVFWIETDEERATHFLEFSEVYSTYNHASATGLEAAIKWIDSRREA
jgi:hypothetical protein